MPRRGNTNREKSIVFKFSLNPSCDQDILYYLKSITNKNKRGRWIVEALKVYKMIESELKITQPEVIKAEIKNCLEELKKNIKKTNSTNLNIIKKTKKQEG